MKVSFLLQSMFINQISDKHSKTHCLDMQFRGIHQSRIKLLFRDVKYVKRIRIEIVPQEKFFSFDSNTSTWNQKVISTECFPVRYTSAELYKRKKRTWSDGCLLRCCKRDIFEIVLCRKRLKTHLRNKQQKEDKKKITNVNKENQIIFFFFRFSQESRKKNVWMCCCCN